MTGRLITDPSELRRGIRIGWEWGANPAGERMIRDRIRPSGRLVTVADAPVLTRISLAIRVDGRPELLLDPRLALERGRPLSLLEDAPIPRVLNQHRDGRPASAVYIGRPSPWGNPFAIGRDGDRDEVMGKYVTWLGEQPDLVEKARRELAGKDLVCWCVPAACHGHVLRNLALGRPLPRAEPPAQPGFDL